MALPAFPPDYDYSWLIAQMRDPAAMSPTTFLNDAFAAWRLEPGERSYHEMYGYTAFFPTEPYDDGGGACLAAMRFEGCV